MNKLQKHTVEKLIKNKSFLRITHLKARHLNAFNEWSSSNNGPSQHRYAMLETVNIIPFLVTFQRQNISMLAGCPHC